MLSLPVGLRAWSETAMHGDDAAAEVEVFATLQPRLLEHANQGRLIGMHADRFGEVLVAVGVAGHQLAERR